MIIDFIINNFKLILQIIFGFTLIKWIYNIIKNWNNDNEKS